MNSQVPAGADVTLASYQAGAQLYVERTPPSLGPQLSDYLDSLASYLSPGDSLLELGSGPGRAAEYLGTKHLRVRRTDGAPAFVDMMRSEGFEAHVLDLRSDDLGGPFEAILAVAVLLHLDRAQLETFLYRAHTALTPRGLLAFTVKEGEGSAWTTEKLDSPRFFTYWREPGLLDLMARTRWTPLVLDRIASKDPWIFVIARSDADAQPGDDSSTQCSNTQYYR